MRRLDEELVARQLFSTRSKATQAIKSGIVYCDQKPVTKCGFEVKEHTQIEIRGETLPYVSRGGWKLEKAIRTWQISLQDVVMVDIGSSTGGFSDCALQHGAKKVYAIDVGSNQFDTTLAKDSRIVLMEKTDFRGIEKEQVADATLATIDVSFISVKKLMDKLQQVINLQEVICLIKPQFECGKEIAEQYRGVVVQPEIHYQVIQEVLQAFEEHGFACYRLTYSPISGGDGNIEYLAYLKRKATAKDITKGIAKETKLAGEIQTVIQEAFEQIKS